MSRAGDTLQVTEGMLWARSRAVALPSGPGHQQSSRLPAGLEPPGKFPGGPDGKKIPCLRTACVPRPAEPVGFGSSWGQGVLGQQRPQMLPGFIREAGRCFPAAKSAGD